MTEVPASLHILPPRGVQRVGLGYRAELADATFMLDRVRSSRGEVSGELCVEREGPDGNLFRGRFNASSLTVRTSTARYLTARGGGDWVDALETFCRGVLLLERCTAPVLEVGRLPVATAPQRAMGGWMPRGAPTSLFAPGGAGKSSLARAVAVTYATGVEIVPGWTVDGAGGVLVIDWEATPAEWNAGIRGIAVGAGIQPPAIPYIAAARPLVDIVEAVAAEVAERRVDLLIVDSVGLAAGTAHEGGDAAETALRLFAALRAIGCTSLLVDHVKGDDMGSERTGTRAYGSVYKWNLSRSVIELRREDTPGPDGAELLIVHRKLNDGPLMRPMGLRVAHDSDGAIRFARTEVSAPELEQHAGTTAERMTRCLRYGSLTDAAIAETLGVKATTVRSALARHPARFRRLEGGRIGLAM